jgi:magnesium chelatase family protein
MGRISGPLMDRFDLRIEVPPVGFRDLDLPPSGDSSDVVARRVLAARQIQETRFAGSPLRANADAEGAMLEEITQLDSESRDLMIRAADRMKLTARGYHRILRVARTIADLDQSAHLRRPHIAEALSYRLIGACKV